MRANGLTQFSVIALLSLLCACSHPHVAQSGMFNSHPEPGYAWAYPDSWFSYEVSWRPGSRHPNAAHVHAAQQPGWELDDGYVWANASDQGSLDAKWQGNVTSSLYPHIVSAEQEGQWLPYPGYRFTEAQPSYPDHVAVAWSAGSAWPGRPNIHASWEEGKWMADTGYHFVDPSKGLAVAADAPDYPYGGPADDTGRHIANALALSLCPDADEDSWTITRIISDACDEQQRKEVGQAIQGALSH